MAAEFESMRLMAETQAPWQAEDQEWLTTALRSPLGQQYLWGDAA